ncbi:hypothetical protein V1477_006778 [Vespula maculifrons]|uniref:Uncharacterized protein n=1 Tax=Vespula maculifrons TaxID=7453 RepID=A0ABD2CGN4_VESMC
MHNRNLHCASSYVNYNEAPGSSDRGRTSYEPVEVHRPETYRDIREEISRYLSTTFAGTPRSKGTRMAAITEMEAFADRSYRGEKQFASSSSSSKKKVGKRA